MNVESLPVVVVGGGPIGLAAAANLLAVGEEPLVLEAGAGPGASLLEWGHVRLFSPWRYVVDAAAVKLLESRAGRGRTARASPPAGTWSSATSRRSRRIPRSRHGSASRRASPASHDTGSTS